ncbi:hypothetical protein Lal_00016100 [Lupinus albus]|uniref:Uncharacterized protein n=1 Tax=Lupinus albus TaxID=3870 RepID=A0A6A5MKK3_LUPAL|nr:hypothetical protein Lalb_Chr05g0220081 [Lupinus albus]KAF1872988.1 hypothetical protein Lal_00016100 [Lupinus albus]
MNTSLSSPTVYASGKVIISLSAILFIFFVSSANCRLPTPLLPSPTSSRNNNHHQRYYCDSFSNRNSRSLCMKLQRIHSNLHLRPPKANGIDPRYGEEKRLVPCGPNPLHN